MPLRSFLCLEAFLALAAFITTFSGFAELCSCLPMTHESKVLHVRIAEFDRIQITWCKTPGNLTEKC